MHECLGSWADFSAMWHASGCGELSSTHIPIFQASRKRVVWFFYRVFRQSNLIRARIVSGQKKAIEAARQQFGVGALDASGAMHGEQSTQLR